MTTETRMTAREAAEKAVKYKALKEAEAVLNAELAPLNEALKQYILDTGEPICVEGQPPLRVKQRDTSTTYDAKSFAKNETHEFERALEMGGVTFNGKVMKALVDSGQLTKKYEQYGTSGSTNVLAFDKEQ